MSEEDFEHCKNKYQDIINYNESNIEELRKLCKHTLMEQNETIADLLSIISSIRGYIVPLKKQIDNYPNEIPKELLLTHINILLNKLPKKEDE